MWSHSSSSLAPEEGVFNAQLRKEAKYSELVADITATEVWKPMLFTLEVGARGLVGLSTHKTFVRLGLTSPQAKVLCKRLSSVVVRCSYAIYQAHNNLYWSHNHDLIVAEGTSSSCVQDSLVTRDAEAPLPDEKKAALRKNVQVLRDNDVQSLFHFTDASNLDSISKHGLWTWKELEAQQIPARLNSSGLSHQLDLKAGLANFVRLSFCKKHPMMYLALKDGRISRPVILEIKLEVVSRPGVLFCAINAASTAAKASEDPCVIHFETVKADSQRSVAASERTFFQGEVLVPDWIPPHLIKFPKVDAMAKPLEFRGRLPDSSLVGCACGEIGVRDSNPFSLANPLHQVVAAGAGSSAPKDPLISLPHPTEEGNCKHETFVAPKPLGNSRTVVFPEGSKVRKLQREREEKLKNLVDQHHVLQIVQFAYDPKRAKAWMLREPSKVQEAERALGCEMPLSARASCADCRDFGAVMACPKGHMRLCGAPIFLACDGCDRTLCWEHIPTESRECYCKSRSVGTAGAAERERERVRERTR